MVKSWSRMFLSPLSWSRMKKNTRSWSRSPLGKKSGARAAWKTTRFLNPVCREHAMKKKYNRVTTEITSNIDILPEHVDEEVVGQNVQLLNLLPLHIGATYSTKLSILFSSLETTCGTNSIIVYFMFYTVQSY